VGIKHALEKGADYIFLLNNDTTVDRTVLVELVEACQADPAVGLASPKVYYYDRPNTIFYAGARRHWLPLFPNPVGIGEQDRGQHDAVREADYVWGQAMFVRRRVVEDIGLLDPGFFMYYEDCDYCLRAAEAGYKIICVPMALVWHKIAKGTEGNYLARWQYRVMSMLHFHRKYGRFGWPQAVLLTIATLTRITARELWRGNWRPLPQMARSFIRHLYPAAKEGLEAN
jgi:GT2 family glycosyltransferase